MSLFPDELPTVRVARPVELAPPCPKLRRYQAGGWSIDSGGERVWDPALPPYIYAGDAWEEPEKPR